MLLSASIPEAVDQFRLERPNATLWQAAAHARDCFGDEKMDEFLRIWTGRPVKFTELPGEFERVKWM